MCKDKEHGGARCKRSTSSAYRHNKRAGAKSLSDAAVTGVPLDKVTPLVGAVGTGMTVARKVEFLGALTGSQDAKAGKAATVKREPKVKVPTPRKGDTTANSAGAPEPRRVFAVNGDRVSRNEALGRYGDWMDHSRVFEVSATAHNGTRMDLEAALHSGQPVGPWRVTETFRDHDGDIYALVEMVPADLTDEDNVVVFDDVGVESTMGVATLTTDGQSDVLFREGAETAFADVRHARECTGLAPLTERQMGEANFRAQMWAGHWERRAGQDVAKSAAAAGRMKGQRDKMQSARAVAADVRKGLKAATTPAEAKAAWDNDNIFDLSEKTQSALYDLYVNRSREVARASK